MRAYNFSPGPAQLPLEVLETIKSELPNWHNSGCSVMELSHRGKEFVEIAKTAESNLRELLNIPENYTVLFLQGGASQQFAQIPLNFLKTKAAYATTGSWSKKALAEAQNIGQCEEVFSGKANNFTSIAPLSEWNTQDFSDFDYLHIASNETIGGVQFQDFPDTGCPLIADMSSDILSREIDVSKFSLIYAGAQKNLGPAGVSVVIIKNDFLKSAKTDIPNIFAYQTQAEKESMYNTPPCFAWYVVGEVLKWVKETGFINVIAENGAKAQMLYQAIDASNFYNNPVEPAVRSAMNIPFTLAKPELDTVFLEAAQEIGLLNLKGHRSVGGMRASIYNAMPIAGVEKLVNFMQDFELKNK